MFIFKANSFPGEGSCEPFNCFPKQHFLAIESSWDKEVEEKTTRSRWHPLKTGVYEGAPAIAQLAGHGDGQHSVPAEVPWDVAQCFPAPRGERVGLWSFRGVENGLPQRSTAAPALGVALRSLQMLR